jgi:hypothetical protein
MASPAAKGPASYNALMASAAGTESRSGKASIKITDLKCAIIARNPVVRIITDQGISGYGEAESAKP